MLDACSYEKIEKLGEGTYGVVYRAKDRHRNCLVALKKVSVRVFLWVWIGRGRLQSSVFRGRDLASTAAVDVMKTAFFLLAERAHSLVMLAT